MANVTMGSLKDVLDVVIQDLVPSPCTLLTLNRHRSTPLPLGLQVIDTALHGGLTTGTLIEVSGQAGAGTSTLLAHSFLYILSRPFLTLVKLTPFSLHLHVHLPSGKTQLCLTLATDVAQAGYQVINPLLYYFLNHYNHLSTTYYLSFPPQLSSNSTMLLCVNF